MDASSSPLPPRQRLRQYWLRFDELAAHARQDKDCGEGTWRAGHRAALDELIAAGEITTPAADLVQEAYEAALQHVWRANAPMTCYRMIEPAYGRDSAASLVEQARILNELAAGGRVAVGTLAQVRAALEHDLAFCVLTPEEEDALRKPLFEALGKKGQNVPAFADLKLEHTPAAQAAARFLFDTLNSSE